MPGCIVLLAVPATYFVWSPGEDVRDGRHDTKRNGIWLQHGWFGDDEWFRRYNKIDKMTDFRNEDRIGKLAAILRENHITDVFPHLCPAQSEGEIPKVDAQQTERFLDAFGGFRVMPWVGGNQDMQAFPSDIRWRSNFVASVMALLHDHPRLSGIHLNIEPCPSGDRGFLALLEEFRNALPRGKTLSVAAYPPPTRWHPFPDVHWDEEYFREVAKRSDQIVVMMYDTGLKKPKLYRWLMTAWTREVLAWAGNTSVLLGIPTYADEDVGYHHPSIENLQNALPGIHEGLSHFQQLPTNYQGVSIYCEWETDANEWQYLRQHFLTNH